MLLVSIIVLVVALLALIIGLMIAFNADMSKRWGDIYKGDR